jgi:hypothetical protein
MASSRRVADRRNEALCQLLTELGWSLNGFAQRIRDRCQTLGRPQPVSRSTVSRWCNGAVAGPELIGPACSVLSAGVRRRVTPESLGWPGDSLDVAVEALRYGDLRHAVRMLVKLWELDSTASRATLRSMSFDSTVAPAVHEALVMLPDRELAGAGGGRRVSTADIELLERHTDLYGGLEARHGGGRFRNAFASFLHVQATPMLTGTFSAARGLRLYGSVADAVLAVADMAHDDHLPGLARRYDLQAMRLAQAIGDRGRLARGHIHQARLSAVHGEAGDVLMHARSAVVAAGDASALVRAYAAVTEARAWAFNGEPERTLAAVERARTAFMRADPAAGPRWLRWLDRAELEGQAAWALARAGLVEPGARALELALAMPTERTRDHVELMITEAELARLRQDESECTRLLKRASNAARDLKSYRLADRIARASKGPLRDF